MKVLLWFQEDSRREKIFKALLAVTEELGRAPTFDEATTDVRLPAPNDYAAYFGSFTEACKQAELKVGVYKKVAIKKPRKTDERTVMPQEVEEVAVRREVNKAVMSEKVNEVVIQKEVDEVAIPKEIDKKTVQKEVDEVAKSEIKPIETVETVETVETAEIEVSDVSTEELIKELVDFSIAKLRFPRYSKRNGQLSDEGKLPRSLGIYRERIGSGKWSDVCKAIKENLPDNMWFDTVTNSIRFRYRGQKKLEEPKVREKPMMVEPEIVEPKAHENPMMVEPEIVEPKAHENPMMVEPKLETEPGEGIVKIHLDLTITLKIEGADYSVEVAQQN